MTATKTKPRPTIRSLMASANGQANGQANGHSNGLRAQGDPSAWHGLIPGFDAAAAVSHSALLPIESLRPSPRNPPQRMQEDNVADIAASVAAEGVLVPVIVRPMGDGYELIAGHRRWAAAKLAGQTHIRADVYENANDSRALIVQITENLQREGLDPISEAQLFDVACRSIDEGGEGLTQSELARRIGKSQAYVSNSIRLLALKEPWLGRVISHQLPASHAKELLAWKDHPKILKRLNEMLLEGGESFEAPTLVAFRRELRHAVLNETEPLANRVFQNGYIDYAIDVDALDDATREKLSIVEVENWDGETTRRATNTKLADRLLAKARDAAIDAAEQEAKKAKKGNRQGAKSAKGEKEEAKELTPAEKRAREKEAAEQLAKRVAKFRLLWRRDLVADQVQLGCRDKDGGFVRGRVVLWLLARPCDKLYASREKIEAALDKATCVTKGTRKGVRQVWPAIARVENRDQPGVLADVLADGLRSIDFDGYREASEQGRGELVALVDGLVELLEIDLAKAWRDDEKIRRAFLTLHNSEQLDALAAKEWKQSLNPAHTKSQKINGLMAPEKHLALPKGLQ